METIACFKNSSDAEAALDAITGDGRKATTRSYDEFGIVVLIADGVGSAPESIPGFDEVAAQHNAIRCEQCASPEVQFPDSPGDKWVLPQIADKLKDAVTSGGPKFRCRKCDWSWDSKAS